MTGAVVCTCFNMAADPACRLHVPGSPEGVRKVEVDPIFNVLEWREIIRRRCYVSWEATDRDGVRHVIVDRARCPGLESMELSCIDPARYSLHTYPAAVDRSCPPLREDRGFFPTLGDVFEAIGCNGRFIHASK